MKLTRPKAVVAMSGGVDSSVAAALLLDHGYELTGLFLDTGVEGSGRADQVPAVEQVRRVGVHLGIPVEIEEQHEAFEQIIRDFADQYARGRTPNPCILCNERFKFAHLTAFADRLGAETVATGHYARVARRGASPALERGLDRDKDQSYYLFRIGVEALRRAQFPLGEMTKQDVRARARALDLPVLERPESQDVCFAGEVPYVAWVQRFHPESVRPGEVRDVAGRVVGEHAGLANYTIGQRHGLGIALGEPMYVADLDPTENVVTLGTREALLSRRLTASGARWLTDPPAGAFRVEAQVRYRHRAAAATVTVLGEGRIEAVFDEPQWAITPGQAVVLYDGDVVLGGAWIEKKVSG